MYPNSLVEENGQIEKTSATQAGPKKEKIGAMEWPVLGQMKKNILIIVRYPNAVYMPDDQLNFLVSVLGACKLSLGDVAIVNISNAPSPFYKPVLQKFRSTTTILFGLTPQEFEMPVDFPEFQVQNVNSCIFLHAPTLETLEADKILKSKLWVCLKKIFDLP